MHPHIVPIFSVHEAAGFIFYAMAYVEGETVGERVRRDGPLAPADAVQVLMQVAAALAYAHARGVVHRDVTPENILLERATGRALVTDFGIARLESLEVTDPGRVLGTAEFISPEQATGQALIDGRSDLYARGAAGFCLLSGRCPFTPRAPHELPARHVREPAPRLDAVAPWVPGWLADAIGRCLEKTPVARFADAEELGRALAAEERRGTVAPLAVRAFLTESAHLSVLALVYCALLGIVALPATAAAFLWSVDPILRSMALGGLIVLLLGPVAFAVRRVRRLVAAGHRRADLVTALQATLERRREELAFVYGARGGPVERLFRAIAYLGVLVAGAAALGIVAGPPELASSLQLSGAAAARTALAPAVAGAARTARRTDPQAERRLRFWRGPVGRWLFEVARARLPQTDESGVPVTPEVTG